MMGAVPKPKHRYDMLCLGQTERINVLCAQRVSKEVATTRTALLVTKYKAQKQYKEALPFNSPLML